MAYLLDANVFITAYATYYGMDICPGFWDWLAFANKNGRVFSIEKVQDELKAQEDDLAKWAKGKDGSFFLKPEPGTVASLHHLSAWVYGQKRYRPAAVTAFLNSTDYFLIAHAHATKHTVVTLEQPAPNAIREVKIPDACQGLGVACITPYQMLKSEKARFKLSAR